jgi:hypothetical protein
MIVNSVVSTREKQISAYNMKAPSELKAFLNQFIRIGIKSWLTYFEITEV